MTVYNFRLLIYDFLVFPNLKNQIFLVKELQILFAVLLSNK